MHRLTLCKLNIFPAAKFHCSRWKEVGYINYDIICILSWKSASLYENLIIRIDRTTQYNMSEEKIILTEICQMNFPNCIHWMNLFPILLFPILLSPDRAGWFFISICFWIGTSLAPGILIRPLILWHLIWVCTDCICPSKLHTLFCPKLFVCNILVQNRHNVFENHIIHNKVTSMIYACTVVPAKSDSEFRFCLQSYQGLTIDRSL